MADAMATSPGLAAGWRYRAQPYAQPGYFATMTEVAQYTLKDVAGKIATPLFITSPEGEQFWPGQ